jgi:hypothetical protein
MKEAGVDVIEVVFGDKVFSCTLKRFFKYAVYTNRGFGPQLFLPLQYWDTRRIDNHVLPQPERRKIGIAQATLL